MNNKKTIWSGITSAFASILAILGMISCCGVPILAGILATIGIGASQLSFFAKYRGYFLLFAIIALIYGFYQAYFKKKSACCCNTEGNEGSNCKKAKTIWPQICLWIGTAATLLALFMGNTDNATPQSSKCCPTQDTTTCSTGCHTEDNSATSIKL